MTKKMNYTLWTAQGLLALLFLLAGAMKLILSVEEMTKLMPLPDRFQQVIDIVEVLGECGLILPGLAYLVVCGLNIIMIGASVLTLENQGAATALFLFAVGSLLVSGAYRRFAATKPGTFRVEQIFRWPEWSPSKPAQDASRSRIFLRITWLSATWLSADRSSAGTSRSPGRCTVFNPTWQK